MFAGNEVTLVALLAARSTADFARLNGRANETC
jgi:hypothetical protein